MNASAIVGSAYPTFSVPGICSSRSSLKCLNAVVLVAKEPMPRVSKKLATKPVTPAPTPPSSSSPSRRFRAHARKNTVRKTAVTMPSATNSALRALTETGSAGFGRSMREAEREGRGEGTRSETERTGGKQKAPSTAVAERCHAGGRPGRAARVATCPHGRIFHEPRTSMRRRHQRSATSGPQRAVPQLGANPDDFRHLAATRPLFGRPVDRERELALHSRRQPVQRERSGRGGSRRHPRRSRRRRA